MSGPLHGGRRRRRTGGRILLLCLLLAPLAVVAAAYLAYVRDDTVVRSPAGPPSLAVAGPNSPAQPEPGGSLEPRSIAPIRLTGVDAFRIRFAKWSPPEVPSR